MPRGSMLVGFALTGIVAIGSASEVCAAADWWGVQAKVTRIEASNVGAGASSTAANAALFFMVDQNVPLNCVPSASCCVSGTTWLMYAPKYFGDNVVVGAAEAVRQMANTKAILSTLQLALALGTKVELAGYFKVGGYCQVESVQSLPY